MVNSPMSCLVKACAMRQPVRGKPPLKAKFIHRKDVYSDPPEVVVANLEPNQAGRWVFANRIRYRQVKGGHKAYRYRKVAGVGHGRHSWWRAEGRMVDLKKQVDGKTVCFRKLSYVTSRREEGRKLPLERHGWIMNEYTLKHQDGAGKLVLCEVYRSNREKKEPVRVVEGAVNHFSTTNDKEPESSDRLIISDQLEGLENHNIAARQIINLGEKEAPQVLSIINGSGIPPDCMEGRISLELSPAETLSREMIQEELGNIVPELEKFAVVTFLQQRTIISLLGNAENSELVLDKLSNALMEIGVNWQQMERRESEGQVTNITVVVNDSEAMRCLQALNSAFSDKSSPFAVNSSSAPAASSGSKRKVAEDAPPAGRRQTNPQTPCSVLQQTDEDDEEVQGADLEFNNCPILVNSSTEISSEPIHYNHPEPPQDMTDTGGCWTPEEEIQMPNGVQAHQDLNNYIHMTDEPELLTEVVGCAEFANPAYETWYPTEDGWAIHLGHDEYPDFVIDPLWVFSE